MPSACRSSHSRQNANGESKIVVRSRSEIQWQNNTELLTRLHFLFSNCKLVQLPDVMVRPPSFFFFSIGSTPQAISPNFFLPMDYYSVCRALESKKASVAVFVMWLHIPASSREGALSAWLVGWNFTLGLVVFERGKKQVCWLVLWSQSVMQIVAPEEGWRM